MYRIFIFACCLLFLCNCTNDSAHQDSNDGVAMDSTNLSADALDLDTVLFSITTPNQQEDPKLGIPSFDIYLHIAGVDDSIFLARDHSATFMDKDMIEDYSILVPKDVLFLINSYYAGAGYYYYGLNDARKLNIYRIFVEEGSPETEGKDQPARKPELLKTVMVFSNKIETTADNSGG